METFHDILKDIESLLTGYWFVSLLLATGLFYTIYLGFPQIRYFLHALRVVRGKYDKKTDKGDTTHFQALTTALSGTVGTGNIAGVALAIHLGGPAALFWMLVTAFLGMTSKFVEVTLSHKYREQAEDGTMAGGPMYYMKNKLNWKPVAVMFAAATVLCSFGTGNLPQINSISDTIYATFNIDKVVIGGVLAVFLALVIVGGIKRIAQVTEKLVPAMAVVYLIGAFAVIFYNADQIIPSFMAIFGDIFTGTAAVGGFLGAGISFALDRGVNRGLFSNEAGQGSAPIAHAAARTDEPVSEGFVAILEPFIDTIVICTITGLVLLSSGVWTEKFENKFQNTDLYILSQSFDDSKESDRQTILTGLSDKEALDKFSLSGQLEVKNGEIQNPLSILHARSLAEEVKVYQTIKVKNEEGEEATKVVLFSGQLTVNKGKLASENPDDIHLEGKSLLHSAPLTTKAFTKSFFGEKGKYIVAIGLLLFAFSTAISWSYYGDRAMTFLFGSKSVLPYRIVYVVVFFVGAITDTTLVWTIAGIAIVLMTVPNLIGILFLHKDMKQTIQDYWTKFNKEHPKK